MKKIAALLVSVMLVLGMFTAVFAANTERLEIEESTILSRETLNVSSLYLSRQSTLVVEEFANIYLDGSLFIPEGTTLLLNGGIYGNISLLHLEGSIIIGKHGALDLTADTAEEAEEIAKALKSKGVCVVCDNRYVHAKYCDHTNTGSKTGTATICDECGQILSIDPPYEASVFTSTSPWVVIAMSELAVLLILTLVIIRKKINKTKSED